MFKQLHERMAYRIFAATLFAALIGATDYVVQEQVVGPFTGITVGLLCGLMVRNWWALLVAPGGFVLGWGVATLLVADILALYALGWVMLLGLSVVAAAIGVLISQRLETRARS